MRTLRPLLPAAAAATLLAAACSDDPVGPGIDPTLVRVDSVDAAASGWTYVSLANPGAALALTDAQARTSAQWDVAFRGYDLKVNGGETGPGGVTAYCVCANSNAMRDQTPAAQAAFFRALTAEGELPKFTRVTPDSLPAAASFRADTVASIKDWWTAGANGARAVRTAGVYVIHRPNNLGYAKLQFVSAQNTSGDTPGTVTFRYALLPRDRSAFGATQTGTVTVPATGAVAFSFTTNAAVDTTQPYDLIFRGWRAGTNSGERANATTPAWGAYDATRDLGPQNTTSFEGTGTRAVAPTRFGYVPEGAGTFNLTPSWFYDFTTNTPYPNYDVFLVRRGPAVWKLQVIRHPRESTFGSGQWLSRNVLFRTSQLTR
jgi:hypothetical protein